MWRPAEPDIYAKGRSLFSIFIFTCCQIVEQRLRKNPELAKLRQRSGSIAKPSRCRTLSLNRDESGDERLALFARIVGRCRSKSGSYGDPLARKSEIGAADSVRDLLDGPRSRRPFYAAQPKGRQIETK